MRKMSVCLAAIPLFLGVAAAQETSKSETKPATPQSTTTPPSTTAGSNTASTAQTGSTAPLAEVKTMTYKGTLVDASCAGGGMSTTSSNTAPSNAAPAGAAAEANPANTSSRADRSTSLGNTPSTTDASASVAANTPKKEKDKDKGSANRADAGGSCTVSSSTSRFALKMEDGRTVPFDSVGDLRAQEAMKNKKKWSDAASAGKPIRAKVSGVMSGDKLTVVSVN